MTFFDMPGVARRRGPGDGPWVGVACRRVDEALDFWERRLAGAGVASDRMADRLVFSDPEGLGLELVIDDGEDEPLIAAAADVDAHLAIRGMHAVRAYRADAASASPVRRDVLGMQPEGEGRWLARGERRHGLVIYDNAPGGRGTMGAGTMHHVAFTIRDGDGDAWRERVAAAGLRPTPVLDRRLFKSIYFREPSGVLFELATEGPGFVFESPDRLGRVARADRRPGEPPERVRAAVPAASEPARANPDQQDRRMTSETTDSGRCLGTGYFVRQE